MAKMSTVVRELVRELLRTEKIKYKTNNKRINTVCYAQRLNYSVEFQGPIHIYCGDILYITMHAYGMFKHGINEALSGWIDAEEPILIDKISININDSNFTEKFVDFITKHVPLAIRKPDPSKLMSYKNTSFVSNQDLQIPKVKNLSLWGRLRFMWQIFRNETSAIAATDDNFYFEQALIRHCPKMNQSQITDIIQTANGLMLEANPCQTVKITNQIMEQRSEKL